LRCLVPFMRRSGRIEVEVGSCSDPRSSSCCRPNLLLLLTNLLALHVTVASSKYACEYSNRLCQWQASYAFGAAVVEDKVRCSAAVQLSSMGPNRDMHLVWPCGHCSRCISIMPASD
jgi:hypothetical protein